MLIESSLLFLAGFTGTFTATESTMVRYMEIPQTDSIAATIANSEVTNAVTVDVQKSLMEQSSRCFTVMTGLVGIDSD